MSHIAREESVHSVIKSRLRLKHFEVFRNVCTLQTIRKAAVASNITQPAASKLIQELEDMFQVVLFQRNRRGMRLTKHGDILLRHIGIVMADISNIRADLDQSMRGTGGVIRLGILPSLSSVLLARAINTLLETLPCIQFSVHEGTTDALLDALRQNDLDIAFGRALHAGRPANLRATKVYTEAFDIVCGRQHPMAKQAHVKWQDLASARWVLPVLGTPLREIADSMFTATGNLRPVAAVACGSFHHMRYVIAAGQLLGVLPHSMAQQGCFDGDLVILQPEHTAKVAPISLFVRSDFQASPAVAAFERIIVEAAKALKLD